MMWTLLSALILLFVALTGEPSRAGNPCVCGDNEICEPEEACDDGNTVSGDGCSYPSCLPEVCGDSITNPDPAPGPAEECDDSNTVDDDGCTAGTTPDCQFDCGDGEVDAAATPAEVCDDGNATNGDGCDDDPSAESPGNCTATACGNDVITPPETCDPPNGETCDANCMTIAPPPTKGQQKCINAVNKNLAGVAKAQTSDNSKCVKDVAAGKTTLAMCLGMDVKGKVGKAGDKTTKTISGKKCTGANLPVAGQPFTDAATVNGAGVDEVQEGLAEVLGDPAAIADKAADKPGAGCQAEVMKQYAAVLNKWLSAANKAKKSTLKGGAAGPAIAAGIDAGVAADTSLAKAESKANTGIAKKCVDGQVAGLFDCEDATTVNGLTLCVIAAAKEAACNALEVADDLDLSCPSDLIP